MLRTASATIVLVLLSSTSVWADTRYTITDLGTLPFPTAINDSGEVVGYSIAKGGMPSPFLYSGSSLRDLSTLSGWDWYASGYPTGINGSGQVVGCAPTSSGSGWHAFLYGGSSMKDLGTLGGSDWLGSYAYGINDNGQVVGGALTSSGDWHAFLYSGSGMTDLGTLGGVGSQANGINSSGQVVGEASTSSGDRHAFLWNGSSMTDLGTLPGGQSSLATGINASRQVVGYSKFSGSGVYDYHAFLYAGSSMTDLGTLGGVSSQAHGINDRGQIVGSASTSSGQQHAFVYSNGALLDLNALFASASSWSLSDARAINAFGQIAGTGTHNGQTRAFLLTPEPDLPEVRVVLRDPASSLTTLVPATGSLKVWDGSHFVSGGQVDTSKPTIVLTHGWNGNADVWDELAGQLAPKSEANIIAFDWQGHAGGSLLKLGYIASRTPNEGTILGNALATTFGSGYQQPVHFIGKSLGTLVNAKAADVLHASGYDPSGTHTQVTILDEAEIAQVFSPGSWPSWIKSVPSAGTAAFVDNYISAAGNLHSDAVNVILTDRTPYEQQYDLVAFHQYPADWYAKTVAQPNASPMGYRWAVETGGVSGQQPEAGRYFAQGSSKSDPELGLTEIGATGAALMIAERDASFLTNPMAIARLEIGGIRSAIQAVGHVTVDLEQQGTSTTFTPKFTLTKNSPSYAWVPITIPQGAETMSFDFLFQGIGDNDYLSIGVDDTLLFAIEGRYAGTTTANSGLLDVSQWAGQDVELFLGLNSVDAVTGGTMSIDNISFQTVPEPSALGCLVIGAVGLIKRRR